MKHLDKLTLTLLLATLLSSCGAPNNQPSESTPIESESTTETVPESESVSESDSTPKEVSGDVTFYAINDFHGAVKENSSRGELGIQRIGSFLKQQGKDGNTLLINSGDYWQGSLESNYSYGEMLTKIANEIEFDSFTIGNHEFDWSKHYIEYNRTLKDPDTGYSVPFLAANIYNYDIKTKQTLDFANLGDKYVIKTLDNGIKVGIIGMMGAGHISSITSNYVDDLTFVNPADLIVDLSRELREQGCHVVALSIHDGGDDLGALVKNNVDVIFASHTHQNEYEVHNNRVPIIQGACNGEYVSKITLHVDVDGTVTLKEGKNMNNIPVATDEGITNIINEYKKDYEALGNTVLANFSSYASSSSYLPNMVTTAFADYLYENDIDFDYAMTNNARATIEAGQVTYSHLYKALPFDNVVYIAEVSGSDLSRQLKYNSFFRNDPNPLNTSRTYTIAVIDYLATHRDDDRDYDKFPSIKIIDQFKKEGLTLYSYREVTKDWLLDVYNSSVKNITVSDFSPSNNRHSRDYLQSSVTFAENKYIF